MHLLKISVFVCGLRKGVEIDCLQSVPIQMFRLQRHINCNSQSTRLCRERLRINNPKYREQLYSV